MSTQGRQQGQRQEQQEHKRGETPALPPHSQHCSAQPGEWTPAAGIRQELTTLKLPHSPPHSLSEKKEGQ